jgi:hypothetical protein
MSLSGSFPEASAEPPKVRPLVDLKKRFETDFRIDRPHRRLRAARPGSSSAAPLPVQGGFSTDAPTMSASLE